MRWASVYKPVSWFVITKTRSPDPHGRKVTSSRAGVTYEERKDRAGHGFHLDGSHLISKKMTHRQTGETKSDILQHSEVSSSQYIRYLVKHGERGVQSFPTQRNDRCLRKQK